MLMLLVWELHLRIARLKNPHSDYLFLSSWSAHFKSIWIPPSTGAGACSHFCPWRPLVLWYCFSAISPSSSIWVRLYPPPFGHYSYLRRFVPSPFFVLSETCCFLMLSSSAFLSLPGQAQIRASKQRRPRTCPLGIREKRRKGSKWKNCKRSLEFSYFYCWSSPVHHYHHLPVMAAWRVHPIAFGRTQKCLHATSNNSK